MREVRTVSDAAIMKTVMMMTVLFFACFPSSSDTFTPDSGCGKWRDSLIAYGMRNLDSGRIDDAGRYFAGAFKCGMRKDSMYYFLSELYLRRMAFDTALVFNMAVEKAGMIPKERWVLQRAKLYWLIGKKQEADSLLSLLKKPGELRYKGVVSLSLMRNNLKLNPFTFIPQNFFLNPDKDIDDMGLCNFTSLFYGRVKKKNIPWEIRLSGSSFFPVPGGHFHDEPSDTLVRYAGFSVSIGKFAETPELQGGMNIGIHDDGNLDRYWNAGFSVPLGKRQYIMLGHNQKLGGGGVLVNAGTNCTWSFLSVKKKLISSGMCMFGHQYERSAMFQNRYDSTGFYIPIPKGYVFMDSAALADNSDSTEMAYYKDAVGTPMGINIKMVNRYWEKQPVMFLLTVPKHSLVASMSYGIMKQLPFRYSLSMNGFVKGVYFTRPLTWYSRVGDEIHLKFGRDVFEDYAAVYNVVDGRYYLIPARKQQKYLISNMLLMEYHEKRRMDAYVQISVTLKKDYNKFGEVYCRGAFTKGFTTLSDNDPLVSFNHAWEIAAGWKKEITVVK